MLCGDFNIDLLNKDCNNSTSFELLQHTNFRYFRPFSDFLLIAIFFCTNPSKKVNKGVQYRLVNQNTLYALDEMLALTNFDDISNDNINEATPLLFDGINNAFKPSCPIRTKTLSPKNTTKP